MKLIPLTQGMFAQVDDWNYDDLNQFVWFAHKNGHTYYAERWSPYVNGKRKIIYMHNMIMHPPIGLEVDHKDRNGLNCLEENLRNCTHQQNTINRKSWGDSKYYGVSPKNSGFQTRIQFKGVRYHLGIFKTEAEAARAYDIKAKELFGEYANLNFPENDR